MNRTLYRGDNLPWLKTLPDNCVDLIATDPPYNAGQTFTGKSGDSFNDKWSSVEEYLSFMEERLVEMHRVLRETGSIYLQCDSTANHHLRMLLDKIFGRKNFINEIVWCYTGPGNKNMKHFPRKHDTIYWYAKGKTWTFNADAVRVPHKAFRNSPMFGSNNMTDEMMDEYENKGKMPESWWTETNSVGMTTVGRLLNENLGYPTQKPVALYERIIKASSNKGDMVLDPFAGSGTTLHAAENLDRKWIGMDLWTKDTTLIEERMKKAVGVMGEINLNSNFPK